MNIVEILEKQGINKDRIIIDPGIGFGKTAEQSWQIINNITEFKKLGTKILVGHSRTISFLKFLLMQFYIMYPQIINTHSSKLF